MLSGPITTRLDCLKPQVVAMEGIIGSNGQRFHTLHASWERLSTTAGMMRTMTRNFIIKKCFIFLKEDITTAWEGIYANTKVYRWILFYLKITQKLDFITKHTLDLQAVTRGLRHFCWWKVWLAMALGAPGQLPLKLKSWLYALCSITLQLLARERDGEPGDSAEEKGLPRIKPPLYPLFWYTELKKKYSNLIISILHFPGVL